MKNYICVLYRERERMYSLYHEDLADAGIYYILSMVALHILWGVDSVLTKINLEFLCSNYILKWLHHCLVNRDIEV